jgi:hypothetical protein
MWRCRAVAIGAMTGTANAIGEGLGFRQIDFAFRFF